MTRRTPSTTRAIGRSCASSPKRCTTRRPAARYSSRKTSGIAALAATPDADGIGLDALWADDFHHHVRRAIAGDTDGYFRSYSGSAADIADTLRRGWFYRGQVSPHTGEPRGTDPDRLGLEQFVLRIQNHDQVGNRAMGDRLHHAVTLAAYRAASALLLSAPETPMLFMGQEWGASTPFLFFTDHAADLGRAVTSRRRAEFAAFEAFADPAVRDRIPDPQDESTFCRSVLQWSELAAEDAQSLLRLHRALLAFRRTTPAMQARDRDAIVVDTLDAATVAVWRTPTADAPIVVVARLANDPGEVLAPLPAVRRGRRSWVMVLTTEDAAFGGDAASVPDVRVVPAGIAMSFAGAAAVVLRGNGH